MVRHTRARVNQKIFNHIYQSLPPSFQEKLEGLITARGQSHRTDYNALKRLPQRPTITHFKELLLHHEWLLLFGELEPYLQSISKIKLRQFAAEAKSLDASDLKKTMPPTRYTLMVCLIHQAQRHAKDALAITFCKTMAKIHKRGTEKLELLREQGLPKTAQLLEAFSDILMDCKEEKSRKRLLTKILKTLDNHGGIETLYHNCTLVSAINSKIYLPLLWDFFASKRTALFKLLRKLSIQSTLANDCLIQAMKIMLANSHRNSEYIAVDS